jgi:hypothetical protein
LSGHVHAQAAAQLSVFASEASDWPVSWVEAAVVQLRHDVIPSDHAQGWASFFDDILHISAQQHQSGTLLQRLNACHEKYKMPSPGWLCPSLLYLG